MLGDSWTGERSVWRSEKITSDFIGMQNIVLEGVAFPLT